MNRVIFSPLAIVLLFFQFACTHNATQNYDSYIDKQPDRLDDITFDSSFDYELTERTRNHAESVRDWKTGIIHEWKIEFGPVLDATLRSKSWKSKFRRKNSGETGPNLDFKFDLKSFEFVNNAADVDLEIVVVKDKKEILRKVYSAMGPKQGGKMFWGGAFAMRNAIQASIKGSLDNILNALLNDLEKAIGKSERKSST